MKLKESKEKKEQEDLERKKKLEEEAIKEQELKVFCCANYQ